jgi:HK97 family phage major capsid protein
MTLETLERQLDDKVTQATAMLDAQCRKAETENRARTEDEITELEAILTDARGIKAKVTRLKGDDALRGELAKLAGSGMTPAAAALPKPRLSLGQQFVQAEAYEFFRKGLHRTSSAWRSPSMELYATTLTEGAGSGGGLITPQYVPGIQPLPSIRLTVADLMAPGTTTSPLVNYMQETAVTNAAAAVAEGAVKPESALVFAQVSEPVRKIATWLPVSEEMLEDVAQIASYINSRLTQFVQIEEEDQLLNGDGIAPNIKGILARTGLAPTVPVGVAPDTAADAIFRQMMAIFTTSLLQPDGVVINPANWADIVLHKNAQGMYYTAGPFAPPAAPTIWGVPVAVTPSIVKGTGLVGAFKLGAQVFRLGGIRVEASNSHQDYFVKNLVAIRAEERAALAVYRPGAFGTVTVLPGTLELGLSRADEREKAKREQSDRERDSGKK